MTGTDPAAYGEAFADVYDDWYGDISDTDAAVEVLAALTAGGRLLELGVGTGRVAIPLAARGIEVHGVDASPTMLERLLAKPGGERVVTRRGDMAEPPVSGPFQTVFVAFNTLFNLTTDAAQRRCLERVRALLEPGGAFVVEAFVPAPPVDATPGDHEETRQRGDDEVRSVSSHDPERQTVTGVHIQTRPDGVVTERAWSILYRTPTQLDAMCADAGLTLADRWTDWSRSPFTADSNSHISVYTPLD